MSRENVEQGNRPGNRPVDTRKSNFIIYVLRAIGIALIVFGAIWYGLVGFLFGLLGYFFLMMYGIAFDAAHKRYGLGFLIKTDALRYVLTPAGFIFVAIGGWWRVLGIIILAAIGRLEPHSPLVANALN